jgi:hypothetical protein
LHRIAFPVVSEWFQKRLSSFTIVLARCMHPKAVQHLDGHTSIQPTVVLLLALGAEYEQDTTRALPRPWGGGAAYRRARSLAGTCVIRSQSHPVASKHARSRIPIQHLNM